MLLANIVKKYNLELIGDSSVAVNKISDLINAKEGDLTFAINSKHIQHIKKCKANCIVTTKELAQYSKINTLISSNPYLVIAKISQDFKKNNKTHHLSAVISPTAKIGHNTNIASNCYIGDNSSIGNNCYLYPNVNIMDNVTIGDNCVISSGCVIGSQGFGNIEHNGVWQNIYHTGGVVIGKDVHIGANTTIDKGTFGNTVIGDGVKIDNLVHLAHNVKIGNNTAIAALTGIAGSTKIGHSCKIGGQVGIIGHVNIADEVTIYANSGVVKSINKSGKYSSFLFIMPHFRGKKISLLITKFDKIIKLLNLKISNL